MSGSQPPECCPLCDGGELELLYHYDSPPAIETTFDFSSVGPYRRDIWRCRVCGHCVNHHDIDMRRLYEGHYVDATYGADGLVRAYQRIMALPPERSDNHQRVRRIVEYMSGRLDGKGSAAGKAPTLLDVGSGLCVFPARMKSKGWCCTALDPDPRAAKHAREYVGVEAVCADFTKAGELGGYDLITFNKVLEHVPEPVAMLRGCHGHLGGGGVVYVELPDAEGAALEGKEREEFGIEHFWVFSMTSLCLLARRAGFVPQLVERLREPSTKYTLRAFLTEELGRSRRQEATGQPAA